MCLTPTAAACAHQCTTGRSVKDEQLPQYRLCAHRLLFSFFLFFFFTCFSKHREVSVTHIAALCFYLCSKKLVPASCSHHKGCLNSKVINTQAVMCLSQGIRRICGCSGLIWQCLNTVGCANMITTNYLRKLREKQSGVSSSSACLCDISVVLPFLCYSV